MNKRTLPILCTLSILTACAFLLIPKKPSDNALSDALAYIAKVDSALQQVDNSYSTQIITIDNPTVYLDRSGNTIEYHCLQSVFFEADPSDVIGLHKQAFEGLLDAELLSSFAACTVGGSPALKGLCEGRAYLCWTLTPKFSFLIEYSPESVSEEDIFRMAESVVLPE